jgi:hypothetical protein
MEKVILESLGRDVSSPAHIQAKTFAKVSPSTSGASKRPMNHQPLPQRWQRARKWFSDNGLGAPDMAQLKWMLESEFVGMG